jgi:hypothetical protein
LTVRIVGLKAIGRKLNPLETKMKKRISLKSSGLMCMAVLVTAVLPCGPVSAQGQSGLGTPVFPQAKEQVERLDKTAGSRAGDQVINSRRSQAVRGGHSPSQLAAWGKAWSHILQADRESVEAINASLLDVDGSFSLAAGSTPKFVEDILGWYGKWQFTVGLSGQAVNLGAGAWDWAFGTKLGKPAGPDSFRDFALKEFTSAVFDPAVFKRGIEKAPLSYAEKLRAIENRLLVRLLLDTPDADFSMPRISAPVLSDMLLAQVDAAVNDIIADAATDFGITAVKQVVSEVGGNIAAGALLSSGFVASHLGGLSTDPFSVTVIGTGLIVGAGVSWAVDKTVEAMGHDPKGKLAGKLVERLKRARWTVIDGTDHDASLRHEWLTLFRFGHPDSQVRMTCGRAAEKLEGSTFLGVKPLLTALHSQRLAARRKIVFHAILGPDADEPKELCLDADQSARLDELMQWARAYLPRPSLLGR